jgi:hypothetical protein
MSGVWYSVHGHTGLWLHQKAWRLQALLAGIDIITYNIIMLINKNIQPFSSFLMKILAQNYEIRDKWALYEVNNKYVKIALYEVRGYRAWSLSTIVTALQ